MKQLEQDIVRAILDYLGWKYPGCFWRQQAGAKVLIDKTGRKHFMRLGRPGCADITGIGPGGQRVEIEVKRPGGKQSPQQKEFEALIKSQGGTYLLVYSVDDVRRHL